MSIGNKRMLSSIKDVGRLLGFGWAMLFTCYSEKENSMMVEIVSLSITLWIRDLYGKTEKAIQVRPLPLDDDYTLCQG